MASVKGIEILRWRPHHIFCEPFLNLNYSERGTEFERISERIKNIMRSSTDEIIELHEGVDELCMVCPLRKNDRCESPQGNEEAVRKYDGKILRGLGLSFGGRQTVRELRELINQKAPLDFCKTRCSWSSSCHVFTIGDSRLCSGTGK